jgi:hypothetical protein
MTSNNNKKTDSTTNKHIDINPGMRLRSNMTGIVYEIVDVNGDDVFLDRLGYAVSKDEIEEGIGGNIEVIN